MGQTSQQGQERRVREREREMQVEGKREGVIEGGLNWPLFPQAHWERK